MPLRLACLLALALLPSAAAQDSRSCVPFPVADVSGPDPVELPQPYANAEFQAAVPSARVEQVERLGLGPRLDAEGVCPSRLRARPWTGAGWGPDTLQTDVTFTDGLPTLINTEDTLAGGSTSLRRITLAYDEGGRIVAQLSEQGDPLEPVVAYRYAYDPEGRLASVEIDILDGDEVSLALREVYTYDGGPYATVLLTEERVDGVWRGVNRSTRTYTADGKRLTFVDESSADGTKWTPYRRLRHAYAADRLDSVAQDTYAGSAWQPGSVVAYTYDAAGRLTRRAKQSPSGIPSQATDFVYDGEHLAEAIDSDSEPGGPMLPALRTRYTFESGEHTESVEDAYDGSAWVPAERRLYVRDDAGRPTERVSQRWASGAFVNASQTDAVYGIIVSAEGAPTPASSLRPPFPNPAKSAVHLAGDLSVAGPVRVAILDALGRTVAVLANGDLPAGPAAWTWDAAGHPAGVYTVQLQAGGRVETQRVTVVR